jgi:hypothetical protein
MAHNIGGLFREAFFCFLAAHCGALWLGNNDPPNAGF